MGIDVLFFNWFQCCGEGSRLLNSLKKKKHKTPKNKTSVESYYLSWEENIKESDKAKTNISPVGILNLCLL